MDNPEKLATSDTRHRTYCKLEINIRETEGAFKNGQSRETGNTVYTRHRQTKRKPQHNIHKTLHGIEPRLKLQK
jgi:hypothetical protein